jgi:hypothetical protein
MDRDIDRAREALPFIPSNCCRKEWVTVGMAAKAAGLSFEDFNNWSATAENYKNERDVAAVWRSFEPNGGIGAATLFQKAATHGYRLSPAPHASTAKLEPSRTEKPATARNACSAADVWARCKDAPEDHGYIAAKRGRSVGLRVVPQGDPLVIRGERMVGWLVVPVSNTRGEIISLQFIASPSVAQSLAAKDVPGKLNLPRAPMAGTFVVGELEPAGIVYVVEGIGTAWACWKATGRAAVVCFGWGMVKARAAELRAVDPAATLVIVPDVGKEAEALEIARAVGGNVAPMPEGWPQNSDLCDLGLRDGFDAVEILLAKATEPQTAELRYRRLTSDDLCKLPSLAVTVADFRAYMPLHQYIFVPSRELWPGSSVNARCEQPTNEDGSAVTRKVRRERKGGKPEFVDVPVTPTEWLDEHHPADQMTWAPGSPMIIKDRLVSNGGLIERRGCEIFNLYLPPNAMHGTPALASRWTDHVRLIYPDDADHIIQWLAHRVQRPAEKINHALVLGGDQGTGKDTLLEAVKHAVGPWNFNEVSPVQLLGRFNSFVKSVILRVSEARDLGEVNRYAFYEHMKVYTAAPPDVLRCDEKNLREHCVMNVCGVVITTNHKGDGIYLPSDDRRHYVAWSSLTKQSFREDYWRELWGWYLAGGFGHVGAYLAAFDLSGFDPKAPPPKTPAFWEIVDANRSPEDAELADVLDLLDNPAALTLSDLQHPRADSDFRAWLLDRRNSRQIPHRLEEAGYVSVRYDGAEHGYWTINGKRQAIYAKKALSTRDRVIEARKLAKRDGRHW